MKQTKIGKTNVPFPFLSSLALYSPCLLQKHRYVRYKEACRPLVIETLKFLYDLDMDEAKEVDLNHPLARLRIPNEVMFAVGGLSGGSPTNVIETYDTRADRWIMIDNSLGVDLLHIFTSSHLHFFPASLHPFRCLIST